ncbi:hypothetical protein [Jiangella mangrovi]|uniref:Flp pilus assembly protein TadG n=1 Tax=Jiangella mangrovi TaxID=1524084 RepID=A0A7W9GNM7_9ACTN|nr:hypothetical protein [Jiangella mangrovi]MBB5787204.1 Flp pilus assembly protein TadG [Jiangella mangrovi]
MTARRFRRVRLDGERGAVAIFAVVIVMALFLAIGLVVDGGGKIRAMQRANAMAAEAARTGAQAVIIDGAGAGHPTIDFAQACQAATGYVTAAGGEPTDCRRVNDTTVQVDTAITYDNVFLSLIGQPTSQATGSAQARLARGVGEEQ